MEPAELPPMRPAERPGRERQVPAWALRGTAGRSRNIVSSIHLQPEEEEAFNRKLQARFREIEANEVRYREYRVDDADLVVVGFGTAGRVALTAVKQARAEGLRVGLLRPISLFPFPSGRLAELAERAGSFLVVEMNSGQMVEDVRLAVEGRAPVAFYGRMGGVVPYPDELLEEIKRQLAQPAYA
jgi:2-oxoglutarate ferredoxin oxidoreductase subunit alpha